MSKRKRKVTRKSAEELLDEFLNYLKAINYSPATLSRRKFTLRHYFAWLTDHSIESPTVATWQDAENYQLHLIDRGLAIRSVETHMVVVRGFERFLRMFEYSPYCHAQTIPLPKVPNRLPRGVLTPEEIEKIFAVPVLGRPEGFTMRALMELTYSTGMRLSEVCSLQEFDIKKGMANIRNGKGGKDRVVPVGERAQSWVDEYRRRIRTKVLERTRTNCEWNLFVGSLYGQPISKRGVSKTFSKFVKAAGIGRRITFHGLRHAFATHLTQNGADLMSVKEMLGHESLATTRVYVRLTIEDLRKAHQRFHPRS